jgi:cytochrome b
MSTSSANLTRVWDLPTRLFHWTLVLAVIGLVVTGNIGGNAMVWHFRCGYTVASLLLFRLIWGVVGGRWSRFSSFIYSPATVLAYMRGQGRPEHRVGHNPLGAGSVFLLLLFLAAQVATGLFSDDEIAASGPFAKFIANAKVSVITAYHADVGKYILLALIVVHIGASLFYLFKKKENLIRPMLHGDKALSFAAPQSRDDAASRLLALAIFSTCAGLVAWTVSLGG